MSFKSIRFGLAPGLVALSLLAAGSAADASTPGVYDGSPITGGVQALPFAERPFAASGLKVFYRKFGKVTLSVDAKGSNDAGHNVRVRKPNARAKVLKAYLMAASNFGHVISNTDIRLAGKKVTWIDSETNDLPSSPGFFNSVLADVTSIVKPRVDASKSRNISFRITENAASTSRIDGEILVVVFSNPAQKASKTVALMFGGQQVSGDRFEIQLTKAIDKTQKSAFARMGLGISFGYQTQSSFNAQYSTIDVNGRRLSSAAGGQDDGADFNGALITVGGIGDSPANPPNPNATPTSPRTDDEAYNLLPFLSKNQKIIRIDTRNPSNDDNIFFAWFEFSGRGEVNKDTDGDGLLDAWEKNGYDHDGDGKVDVPIHRMGANWRHKDLFIAHAWMRASGSETASHKPRADALKAVVDAFARAPVKNPDGKRGIKVHFIDKGGVPHDDDLNPVWSEFDAIMDPLVSEAERRVMRRMLTAHAYENTGSSGLARDIPSSDFIMTLGRFSTNPGTMAQQAGTIMHELGHTLGLRHGGVDHENYKPNHLSVMSYLNQFEWLSRNGKPFLDYERFNLRALNENKLDEGKGLDRVGGDKPLRNYGVRWVAGGIRTKPTGANANVNWNNSGPANQKNVLADINNSGFRSVLAAGFVEWNNIIFDGGSVGAGFGPKQSFMTKPSDLYELSEEDVLRMQRGER